MLMLKVNELLSLDIVPTQKDNQNVNQSYRKIVLLPKDQSGGS